MKNLLAISMGNWLLLKNLADIISDWQDVMHLLFYIVPALYARPINLASNRKLLQISAKIHSYTDVKSNRLLPETAKQVEMNYLRLRLYYFYILDVILRSHSAVARYIGQIFKIFCQKDISDSAEHF